MELDYKVKDLEERKKIVERELSKLSEPTNQQLSYMADYLLFSSDGKQTHKEKKESYPIVTKNRDVTVKKRTVSFEGTVEELSGGEDSIYAMIQNDKDMLLDNREPITQEDIDNIPGIAENLEVIESLKHQFDAADGATKYSLKQQIISKWREIYTIKSSYLNMATKARVNNQLRLMAHMPLEEHVTFDENGLPVSDAPVSLLRADHIAFLLKYYRKLKQESWEDLNSDMHFMILDLENLVDKTLLPHHELLYDLLVWEIDGYMGADIVKMMDKKYGFTHSEQYFSTLWCKKIPKMLAEQAQRDYIMWYYTKAHPEEAKWKICRTCGKVKLAHPFFFHKNTSKDGFYSKCRDCRKVTGE